MKLVQSILTKNPCYTAGRKITVKGLMLHSVGCPQPKASVFINSWNSASYDRACVHGFIDGNDGTVYQTLPWNHRGWHCGSGSKGSANNTHIGVEMCEPACIKYTGGANFTCSDTATAKAVAKRTYEAAVELFAMLCKQYSLDPTADGVIISTGRDTAGASLPTMATQSISGHSLAWATRWTPSVKQLKRRWKAALLWKPAAIPRLWEPPWLRQRR